MGKFYRLSTAFDQFSTAPFYCPHRLPATTKRGSNMHRKMAALAVSTTALLAGFGAMAAPADALGGWQNLPANASCMAYLAAASNPNASGDHIASLAQSGNASIVAQASPSGTGFPGLISCVVQAP
jgi:hypothetical protein